MTTFGWALLALGGWVVGSTVLGFGAGLLLRRYGVAARDTERDRSSRIE